MKNPKNKEIVIVNQDSGYLMIDLANAYCDAGYQVTLIAGRIVERDKPLNNNVRVRKIKSYNRSTFVTRLISWMIATVQISLLVLVFYRKVHVLYVSNPPIGAWINAFLQSSFSLLVYDVYPDALEEIGYANRHSVIYRIWSWFNRQTYAKARRIITISESMASTMANYSDGKSIEIIPIWTDNVYLKPVGKDINPFIKQYSLQGKFVVMYSGNLGETANAEVLLDFAIQLNQHDQIVFVIIGEGSQKARIAQRIAEEKLGNCMLLSWQTPDMLPFSLAAADLSLVSLNKSAGKIALPSKLYSIMSVGVPVLGLCDSDTELERIIRRYDIGSCFDFEQIHLIPEFIHRLSADASLQSKYRANALSASKKYDISNVSKFID